MAEQKLKFRVRPGFRHGTHNQYGPGDVVELTEAEAAGFADKLEPAGAVKAANVKADDKKAGKKADDK